MLDKDVPVVEPVVAPVLGAAHVALAVLDAQVGGQLLTRTVHAQAGAAFELAGRGVTGQMDVQLLLAGEYLDANVAEEAHLALYKFKKGRKV